MSLDLTVISGGGRAQTENYSQFGHGLRWEKLLSDCLDMVLAAVVL